MSKHIRVTIDREGKATVETKGFKGNACYDATRDLEQAMGMRTETKRTPEYDVKEVRSVNQ